MNLGLSKKELTLALVFSAGLYLIPAVQDWFARGFVTDYRELLGFGFWMIGFYWGPMLVLLWLKSNLDTFQEHSVWRDFGCYFLFMFVGISLISIGLGGLFPGHTISLFNRFFSALMWGGFFYGFYRFWLTYRSYQQEVLLRKQAQLQAIKGQLNPHFLFNSLNTISSFIYSKPDSADETLQNLADVLRYSLDTNDTELVCLQDEIEILRSYLAIEQARFGTNLTVDFNIAQTCQFAKVPPLILQPIVENSIQHGITRPLHLKLSVTQISDCLVITLVDNGVGFTPQILNGSKKYGTGLSIMRKRIEHLPKGQFHLSNLESASGACCEIRFKVDDGGVAGETSNSLGDNQV